MRERPKEGEGEGEGEGERERKGKRDYLPLSMTSPEHSGYSGTHPGSVLAVTKISPFKPCQWGNGQREIMHCTKIPCKNSLLLSIPNLSVKLTICIPLPVQATQQKAAPFILCHCTCRCLAMLLGKCIGACTI